MGPMASTIATSRGYLIAGFLVTAMAPEWMQGACAGE